MSRFIANSKKQDLAYHSVLVGRLAQAILIETYLSENSQEEQSAKISQLGNAALLAGLCHDIGKTDITFQEYITHRKQPETASLELSEDGEQIDEGFKSKKFSFQTYPRHEEVSWLLLRRFLQKASLQKLLLSGSAGNIPDRQSPYGMAEYAVYWHHAKPLRDLDIQEKSFGDSDQIAVMMAAKTSWLDTQAWLDVLELFNEIDELQKTQLSACLCPSADDAELNTSPVPAFKANYAESFLTIESFAKAVDAERDRTAVRSAVVSADRVVSQLSAQQLIDYVQANELPAWRHDNKDLDVLYAQVDQMEERFNREFANKRTELQADTAIQLAHIAKDAGTVCLQGPAGCGKTVIALRWLKQLNLRDTKPRRIFIFVPRTAIGEALFHELSLEYGITANIELLTGNRKLFRTAGTLSTFDTPEPLEGTGNLVITTIDQVCKAMLSHRTIDFITELGHAHVLFDEFHELAELPGLMLLFAELLRLRKLGDRGTLLVSATPNAQFCKELNLAPSAFVRVPTFNDKPFELNMVEVSGKAYQSAAEPHPFTEPEKLRMSPGSFLVCNTATLAQQAALAHIKHRQNVICFHSKFTPRDKGRILRQVLKLFGKSATVNDEVLVSGPIVQASLNISTREMHTEACHAENYLQRLGRVNRFAALDNARVLCYFAPDGKGGVANKQALSSMSQLHRTDAFIRFMQKRYGVKAVATLAKMYDDYNEFHELPGTQDAYKKDFEKVLTASSKVFSDKSFNPVQLPYSPAKKKGGKLASKSLRGRSYFVLPLKLTIEKLGTKGTLALLWTDKSAEDELLTDALRGSAFNDDVSKQYLDWTRKATAAVPMGCRTSNVAFLDAIGKSCARLKRWNHLLRKALNRESPVIVSGAKLEGSSLYYLEVAGTNLGLIQASKVLDTIKSSL